MTKQEAKALEFIRQHILNKGYAPSYDEIKDHLGLSSKSGIHRIIRQLQEKGLINRVGHRARSITLPLPADQEMVDSGFLCASFKIAQSLDRGLPVADFQLRELLIAYRRWGGGRGRGAA